MLSMPRKPGPKPDDPAQSKRFIESARELGADETSERFDRLFKRIVTVKHAKKASVPKD
jgi:hypothetical protein